MAFSGSTHLIRFSLHKVIITRSATFSTSPQLLVDFKKIFGRSEGANQLESSKRDGPSDAELVKRELMTSKTLGPFEKSALQSLIAKGFGKIELPYQPPRDVERRMQGIFRKVFGDKDLVQPLQVQFTDRALKFQFLTACEDAFGHCVQNSQLYTIKTVGDAFDFYARPVEGTNGLTQYQKVADLPANLHINYEPTRFSPDSDSVYGGITAFPHQHNWVTGLKWKKIYKSRRSETNWPRVLDMSNMQRNRFPSPFITERHKY